MIPQRLRLPSMRRFSSVVQRLQQGVQDQRLVEDGEQMRAAKRLDRLRQALQNYNNQPLVEFYYASIQYQQQMRQQQQQQVLPLRAPQESTLATIDDTSNEAINAPANIQNTPSNQIDPPEQPQVRMPRGIYIYSPAVGTGKSMLMDLLFATTPSNIAKQRYHFHEFLSLVHQRVHRLQQQDLQTKGRNFSVDTFYTPIERVALELAQEMSLLCLDEFQVTDVCDSVILPQLFSTLFAAGVVLVATSNRPPEKLYENGINREYFSRFVDTLNRHCIIHEVSSKQDYRTRHPPSAWFNTQHPDSKHQMESMMRDILPIDSSLEEFVTKEFNIDFGRTMTVQCDPTGTVGRFHFDDLCTTDRGASDFRALARQLEHVVLEGIPVLTLLDHNRARRFIILVDELYEGKTKLIASSRVDDPSRVFIHAHVEVDESVVLTDTQWIDQAESHGHAVGALASVRELGFAFKRAASRLKEMTSREYWERVDLMQDPVMVHQSSRVGGLDTSS